MTNQLSDHEDHFMRIAHARPFTDLQLNIAQILARGLEGLPENDGSRDWMENVVGICLEAIAEAVQVEPENVDELVSEKLPEPEPNPDPEIGPDWKPCRKLPITVHVREQRPGEAFVSTREGITPAMNDDLIMRGVKGEEYPIGRELFNQTYELVEPSQDDEVYFVVPPNGPPYWTLTRPIPCQR